VDQWTCYTHINVYILVENENENKKKSTFLTSGFYNLLYSSIFFFMSGSISSGIKKLELGNTKEGRKGRNLNLKYLLPLPW